MTDEKSVTVVPEADQPLAATQSFNPSVLLERALADNVSVDRLEKFMDLAERWNEKQAEDAYVRAMSAFRSEAITIAKTKVVAFGDTKFSYAPLDRILDVVAPKLAQHGLSHMWTTEQEDGVISVTCSIRHVDGHSEQTQLSASPDTSGKKNPIQALGSTVSYLERYTFLALTGLAAGNQDDADKPGPEPASIDQLATIAKLLKETKADEAAFFDWLGITALSEMLARDFSRAVGALERKAKEAEKEPAT